MVDEDGDGDGDGEDGDGDGEDGDGDDEDTVSVVENHSRNSCCVGVSFCGIERRPLRPIRMTLR